MKYSENTYEALWQSIEHWLDNWNYPESGSSDCDSCALCDRFYRQPYKDTCDRCPVADFSGDIKCSNTPWLYANKEIRAARVSGNCNKKPIEAEYAFLVDLAVGNLDET